MKPSSTWIDEEEFLPDELVTSDLPAVDLLTGEILERSGPSELDGMLSTPADAMSFEIDELMDDREFALDPGLVGADEGVLGLYTEPIPLWRRVLGLGPAPERNPKICNHWMPIRAQTLRAQGWPPGQRTSRIGDSTPTVGKSAMPVGRSCAPFP